MTLVIAMTGKRKYQEMAIFSKNEIAIWLTEKTLSLYMSYADIIAHVTDNKICSGIHAATLNLSSLSHLLDVHFSSLSNDEILQACFRLSIDASYDLESEDFVLTLPRPNYQLGNATKNIEVDGLELTLIESDDGLVFCVESSYIAQDVDSIQSPYNNGVVVLR